MIVSFVFLTGCVGAPTGEDAPGSLAEVSAALRAAVVEASDEETAEVLDDENGILEQVAVDLVAMCNGEDPIGMGIAMFSNYEMGDVVAAGWDVACPGAAFPG